MVYPVEANTNVYLGSIVALNANGNATPASSVANLKLIGRAEMVYGGIPGQDAVNNPGARRSDLDCGPPRRIHVRG